MTGRRLTSKSQESYLCLGPKEHGDRIGLCGRQTVGKSLCGTHLKRLQRNGTLARKRAPNGFFTPCKHPYGCPSPTKMSGWCYKHAMRIEKYGEPGPVGDMPRSRQRGTGKCKHPDGCDRVRYTAGWCTLHYNRVYLTGDPGPVHVLRELTRRGDCRHPDGCTRRGNAGDGWCTLHANRVRRNGEPGPVNPMREPTFVKVGDAYITRAKTKCQHPDGCKRPMYANGWCSLHYSRIQRNGDPGPVESTRKAKRGRPRVNVGPCKVWGCKHPSKTLGWCSGHYQRIRKNGAPGPAQLRKVNR